MPLQFDHAVIGVHNLEAAIEDYRALGFTVTRGGVHANRATHNALIVFSNATYLELLAPTNEPLVQGEIDFSAMLWPEGLNGFALRSDDLEADAARMRQSGIEVGYVTAGMRRRPDGTLIEWKLALINAAFAPFLIHDVTARTWRISDDPAITTHDNGVLGVSGVVIAAHNMPRAQDYYAQLVGLPIGAASPISLRTADVAVDTLAAVHLLRKDFSQHLFNSEQTHGARFEFVSA